MTGLYQKRLRGKDCTAPRGGETSQVGVRVKRAAGFGSLQYHQRHTNEAFQCAVRFIAVEFPRHHYV
eukprot:COSAG06_NODE_1167_length_10451_cov_16.691654_9_plen_67_part_00